MVQAQTQLIETEAAMFPINPNTEITPNKPENEIVEAAANPAVDDTYTRFLRLRKNVKKRSAGIL